MDIYDCKIILIQQCHMVHQRLWVIDKGVVKEKCLEKGWKGIMKKIKKGYKKIGKNKKVPKTI